MKFRSILAIAALATSVSFATDVMTTETVGWLRVTSSAASTIISVPWVQVGGADASVQVAKLVKTDSLTADGTVKLFYYDEANNVYKGWVLNTEGGNKVWNPTATSAEGITAQAPDADFPIPRGKALFIYRPNGSGDGDIYLYGKYTTTSPTSFTTAQGSSSTPAYTLIGNPDSSAVSLNKSGLFANVGANDEILIPGDDGAIAKTCTWEDGAWGWWNPSYTTVTIGTKTINKPGRDTNVSIPAGRGVWYMSKGGTATVDF